MADLFTYAEFNLYVKETVDPATTDVVRRIAYGWLKSATGLADWPSPVPDSLFAWGLELTAIAYRNPDGAAAEEIDDHNVQWDRARRRDILTAAMKAYSGATQPQYSFPEPDWQWTAEPVSPLING
jgi:hypothetical protein